MRLDQISARIRRRTAWEGIDLGFAMGRAWFLPLWGLWWVTALPVAILASALLHSWPGAVGLAMWWFKPLYEPLLLYWLSRRLFGEELSWREALGEWRRILLPRLLANLTVRRLSSNRSFYMPVSHLEGLRGRERSARLKVLRGSHSAGTWLTIGGVHFEAVLEISVLLLALYLVPSELMPDAMQVLKGDKPVVAWAGNAIALLSMSLIAPFYVAGGFALYVTRRSELEAWDLELAFRRMAPRFRPAVSGAALALLLAFALALPAPQVRAADQCQAPTEAASVVADPETEGELQPGSTAVDPKHVKSVITQVKEEKDFGEKRENRYWKYIGKKSDKPDKQTKRDFAWVRYLAEFVEYALWVGGAVALGWVLFHLLRMADWLPRGAIRGAAPPPGMLFGLTVTPESLPDDVPAAVRALAAEGRLRQALGLLYRATLVHLIHVHRLRIPASATEGECGRLVAQHRPAPEAAFFDRLTRAWVWCAWGHAPPTAARITVLADEWHTIYGAQPDEQ